MRTVSASERGWYICGAFPSSTGAVLMWTETINGKFPSSAGAVLMWTETINGVWYGPVRAHIILNTVRQERHGVSNNRHSTVFSASRSGGYKENIKRERYWPFCVRGIHRWPMDSLHKWASNAAKVSMSYHHRDLDYIAHNMTSGSCFQYGHHANGLIVAIIAARDYP